MPAGEGSNLQSIYGAKFPVATSPDPVLPSPPLLSPFSPTGRASDPIRKCSVQFYREFPPFDPSPRSPVADGERGRMVGFLACRSPIRGLVGFSESIASVNRSFGGTVALPPIAAAAAAESHFRRGDDDIAILGRVRLTCEAPMRA